VVHRDDRGLRRAGRRTRRQPVLHGADPVRREHAPAGLGAPRRRPRGGDVPRRARGAADRGGRRPVGAARGGHPAAARDDPSAHPLPAAVAGPGRRPLVAGGAQARPGPPRPVAADARADRGDRTGGRAGPPHRRGRGPRRLLRPGPDRRHPGRPAADGPGETGRQADRAGPFRAGDGVRLGLTRVDPGEQGRPAVLLLHGHTASADMFLLPEVRNLVDVLLDDGYEPWLLDWRGSCRLPYNETGGRYTYDDVALYDIPAAVDHVRARIGDRPLFVVAHCIGSLSLSLSMTAGLVPGLAGVVSQGVFLTPKPAGRTTLRMSVAGELLKSRIDHIPVDFRKVGLWSKYTPLFALASRGAG